MDCPILDLEKEGNDLGHKLLWKKNIIATLRPIINLHDYFVHSYGCPIVRFNIKSNNKNDIYTSKLCSFFLTKYLYNLQARQAKLMCKACRESADGGRKDRARSFEARQLTIQC